MTWKMNQGVVCAGVRQKYSAIGRCEGTSYGKQRRTGRNASHGGRGVKASLATDASSTTYHSLRVEGKYTELLANDSELSQVRPRISTVPVYELTNQGAFPGTNRSSDLNDGSVQRCAMIDHSAYHREGRLCGQSLYFGQHS